MLNLSSIAGRSTHIYREGHSPAAVHRPLPGRVTLKSEQATQRGESLARPTGGIFEPYLDLKFDRTIGPCCRRQSAFDGVDDSANSQQIARAGGEAGLSQWASQTDGECGRKRAPVAKFLVRQTSHAPSSVHCGI